MINIIAKQEFRYQLLSWQSLIVSGFLFGLAFLFTANGVEFQGMARGGNVFINSPYMIAKFLIMMSVLAVFIAPSYLASAVLKDHESKFDGLLFSTPINKKDYFIGRFTGSFLAFSVVMAALPVGMWLGMYWPWAVPETFGEKLATDYLWVYLTIILPSLFTVSALIFATTLAFPKIIYTYLVALLLVVLFVTVDISTAVSGLWDPFMGDLYASHTEYWTAAERNSQMLALTGDLLVNRIGWFVAGLLLLAVAYSSFSLRTNAKQAKADNKHDQSEASLKERVNLKADLSSTWQANSHWQQLRHCLKFEAFSMIKSVPFIVLMSLCFFLLFFSLTGRQTVYDVNTYPLTQFLLSAIRQALTGALMVVLAFYSAEIMWRERRCKINGVMDALPTPNWVFVVSKVGALILVMLAIVTLGILLAIGLQLVSEHYDLKLDLYIGRGLIYYPIAYIYLAILACFLQVMTNNRVIGMLAFILFIGLLTLSRDVLGIEHMLLSYGLPGVWAPLSEMNPNSRLANAGIWLRVYWGAMAGMLLMLTYMFYTRGTVQPMRLRLKKLSAFNAKGYAIVSSILMVIFVSAGSFIYYNTNVINHYRSSLDLEQLNLDYEQRYKQYENLPMPSFVDVKIDVDIYPVKRRIEARSTQIIKNKTDEAIHVIHLIFPLQAQVVSVDIQGAKLAFIDEPLAYYIFNLDKPMLSGETLTLTFETLVAQQGFSNNSQDIRLVRNGSFFGNNLLAPRIGFHNALVIRDNKKRKSYGLAPLPRVPSIDDTHLHHKNYVSHDSDFVKFETTVSTISGQQAIAPGYLMKQWQEGEREYFHYKMDKPIMNYYSYLSADYTVARDEVDGIDIAVYYHKTHKYNVDRMLESAKNSLSYYSKAFSPYQYKQLRILEFPGYQTLARAYPNTIPFSENIGFVADQSDPHQLDLAYYVTAHEVAHQWWAHQVMAANAQGGTMVVETLAQYSALMMIEKKYGKHKLRQFLKSELDKYLRGRGKESEGELPLYKVENQPYIHYRKGGLVMYALKDYLGENVVNGALKRFVNNHAFKSNPYATSTDFISYLKAETKGKHNELIDDMFKRITLFDLKFDNGNVTERPDGRFKVVINVEASKHYEDAVGNKTPATLRMSIDIGLFTREPSSRDFGEQDVINFGKHQLVSGMNRIEFIVDKKPLFAGIDPYHKLIDTKSDDNVGELVDKEE